MSFKNNKQITLIGALTSKPYAFNARSWELKNIETIDIFDSLCSNIKVDIRDSKIMRILPSYNDNINEEWISDKARFSFDGLNRWRFVNPMIKKNNLFIETNWKECLNSVKNEFTSNKYKNIIINTGYFTDIETIISLKNLSNKLDNVQTNSINIPFDFQNDYLINENLDTINGRKVYIIVGLNLRLENPVLNIKLRKLSKKKNVLIGYIGSYFDSTYNMVNLGNNLDIIKKIFTGKHWFCSYLSQFNKNNLNYELQNEISFIFGQEFFNKYNSINLYNNLKNLKFKNFKISFNTLLSHSGYINALELGFNNTININNNDHRSNLYYLIGTESNNNINKNDTVIFQGHHNDKIRSKIDIIMPSTNWLEKYALYINCFGMIQKTKFVINPPINSRDDWKIIEMLNINIFNKLDLFDLKKVHSVLEKITPNFMKNIGKFKYIRNNFLNLKLSYTTPSLFNIKSLFKSFISNYYKFTSIERASKIMLECSNKLNKSKNNYIKINK